MNSGTDAPRPDETTDPGFDFDDDTCSFVENDARCGESLDDGEGFDGYCGTHADRLEAAGYWS